jgi:hypothetical protein
MLMPTIVEGKVVRISTCVHGGNTWYYVLVEGQQSVHSVRTLGIEDQAEFALTKGGDVVHYELEDAWAGRAAQNLTVKAILNKNH